MMFLFYVLTLAILWLAYNWPNLFLFIVFLFLAKSLLK